MSESPTATLSVTLDGADLKSLDTGEPDGGGPTLLLVHGFPLSRSMWEAQVSALRADCRVIAPDLRGYGDSPLGDWPLGDWPVEASNGGAEPSLDRYADDLAAVLDAARPSGPVVFVGFSMGGYIAFSFLRRHADKLGGLALLDTRAVADDDAARATRLKMAEHVGEWGSARIAELMRPNLFGPAAPQEVVDATTAVIAATDPRAIAASQRAMAARPDSTGSLGGIGLPALVMVGEDDAISPEDEMRGVAEAIPGARFVVIDGAGHMAPVERPDAVSRALAGFVATLA